MRSRRFSVIESKSDIRASGLIGSDATVGQGRCKGVNASVAGRNRSGWGRTAAREFRQHGLNGIGVADLMRAAGLTHGGFYAHFASKDELIAEVITAARSEAGESLGGELGRQSEQGRAAATLRT
ncbi:helix-turn-helix domain-containing protein [Algiphilus sp. W345]|uniref:Helix-turn-helix domain-containing protein n=1 Tax=Banduia mediterranea TaxID=3075609 RepID=A0ABU2WMA3_9GAMM|nr:helix-turn-helix domain-containing protein [Algiphilus sp. W345]MDT0498192.1 helix-turn-helix domain-containing protein [Algiphilus sp. W345]